MDIIDLRGLATVLCVVAFAAVVYWAYAPSRKGYFDEAAQLPFEDEDRVDE
jgi:cytochrome c oxidase cbb3-type subunit 4